MVGINVGQMGIVTGKNINIKQRIQKRPPFTQRQAARVLCLMSILIASSTANVRIPGYSPFTAI